MFRLTLIPFILLFGALFFGIASFLIIRKIKQIFEVIVKKGAKLANEQKEIWAKKEQRKQFPDILQKGLDLHKKLMQNHLSLPQEWKSTLTPLIAKAALILDDVSEDIALKNSVNNKMLNSIRPFFNHTLPALLEFSEKLNANSAQMNTDQIDKARQNITVFKVDLLRHQETLLKAKQMDFDIAMDVIKARLKK